MLFSPNLPPPQLPRTRCRNPRCGDILKNPVVDRRREAAHYATLCLVCKSAIGKKSRRCAVCWRSKCRHELQRHPEKYQLRLGHNGSKTDPHCLTAGLGQNAQENSTKSKLSPGLKSGRTWRVVAGPADLHPINLLPFAANAAASRTGRSGPALSTRSTPPVNIIGEFKFPGAPKINLFEEPATSSGSEGV